MISRQAVNEIINDIRDCISVEGYWAILERMKKLPSVKPQEPKTGHWIRFKEFEDGCYHIKCSECGQYWSIVGHAKIFKHCFNCGAKMFEPQESEEV